MLWRGERVDFRELVDLLAIHFMFGACMSGLLPLIHRFGYSTISISNNFAASHGRFLSHSFGLFLAL